MKPRYLTAITGLGFVTTMWAFVMVGGASAAEAGGGVWKVDADPALPNVLILGDSISIGYTPAVRALFKGRANVYRPAKSDGSRAVNCRHTTYSLEYVDRWLAMTPQWKVIHFNWGLHDLARINLQTKHSGPELPNQVSLREYKENLRQLVSTLARTGAKLIFATTTPFPSGVRPCRLPQDVDAYNAAALEVMREYGVAINDLHACTRDRLTELQRPVNVHFTEHGYEVIANQVVASIEQALGAPVAVSGRRGLTQGLSPMRRQGNRNPVVGCPWLPEEGGRNSAARLGALLAALREI